MNLTWDDYGEIRQRIYRDAAKTELKSKPALPTKMQLKDVFDFVATALDNNRVAIKTGIDSRIGFISSPELAATILRECIDLYLRRYV